MGEKDDRIILVETDKEILARYRADNPWGLYVSVDLKDCDPKLIRSSQKITKFAVEACTLMKVKRFGKPIVADFGEDPRVSGFSLVQLIETSLISGHFANQTNAVYLDFFSCKSFPPYKVAKFAKKCFKAKSMALNINFRP